MGHIITKDVALVSVTFKARFLFIGSKACGSFRTRHARNVFLMKNAKLDHILYTKIMKTETVNNIKRSLIQVKRH